jgi:hypothetical protein
MFACVVIVSDVRHVAEVNVPLLVGEIIGDWGM